ncbi:MAG: NADH:ubiquinone reductase (Na(+)-transporting) subunit C [Proteobacteria bacterium]|nr:NADH:ubiquinone reductase (Na(+)-transporting) subunit C [Pseudomonadota bacterium]
MMDKFKSVFFAVCISAVCSLAILYVSTGLKERQDKNLMTDKHKNILKAAGLVLADQTYPADRIETIYQKNIKTCYIDNTGQIFKEASKDNDRLQLYFQVKDEDIESYIIPIDTKGLWGQILGYLALEKDGSTIAGFTVYHHSETPGLGGEIERSWFQKEFVGKKIVNRENQFVSIAIAKGKAPKDLSDNYVDGISGATLTGKFLTSGLKEILKEYEPVSVKFRTGGIGKIHPQNRNAEDGK